MASIVNFISTFLVLGIVNKFHFKMLLLILVKKVRLAKNIPHSEVLEQHSAWESLTADTDAFQYTVTSQLVKN